MCNLVNIKNSVHCLIEMKLTKNKIFSMIIIRAVIILTEITNITNGHGNNRGNKQNSKQT